MKKYKLKPGNHQFAPGEHGWHNNDNLSDAEAAWYLQKYPHIAKLFVTKLKGLKVEKLDSTKRSSKLNTVKPKPSNISTFKHSNKNNENISATN